MHYKLEVIMPPTNDVQEALEKILQPFNENGTDEEGNSNIHAFWDYFDIGGRWSGFKMEAKLGKERLKKFRTLMMEKKVTVSGLVFGKEEISPASQVPMVDALWREHFSDSGLKKCPLFKHGGENGLPMDICTLAEVPKDLSGIYRIIFAGYHVLDKGKVEATQMFQTEFWNGVTHCKAQWDGRFSTALDLFKEQSKYYRDEYRESITPKDDWLVVTVDYHS